MTYVLRACLALGLSILGAEACAQVVQGRLELQWGDPAAALMPAEAKGAGVSLQPRFNAVLLTDRGQRIALDPEQARRAAGDLHALMGRPVAVQFSAVQPAPGKSGAVQRRVEAIVPADAIDGQREHPSAGKVDAVPKAVFGATPWITIACKFNDIASEQKTVDFFRSQYGDAAGQLGHYWREVSYDKINLAGSDARGWYTLPKPRSEYVKRNESDGKDKADLNALFDDCTAAADAQVNFALVQGINMMFNGELDGFAWGGGRCSTLDGANRCWSSTWNPPWAFENLAPLAHEMGHGYGLPHSDNSDGDDDTYDNPWDVMSDGWRNAVSDPTYGTRPKHINVYQRDRLGWINVRRKLAITPGTLGDETVEVALDYASIDAAESVNTQMLILQTPSSPDPYKGTIYVLEARRRIGFYEAALAGDAVIIHLVGSDYRFAAESQDADWPPADRSNNEGSMFKVGEGWISPDQLFQVSVVSQTQTGFVLRVKKPPQTTGGVLRARRR